MDQDIREKLEDKLVEDKLRCLKPSQTNQTTPVSAKLATPSPTPKRDLPAGKSTGRAAPIRTNRCVPVEQGNTGYITSISAEAADIIQELKDYCRPERKNIGSKAEKHIIPRMEELKNIIGRIKTEYVSLREQLDNQKRNPDDIQALSEKIDRYREEDKNFQGQLLTQFRRALEIQENFQENLGKRLQKLEGENKIRDERSRETSTPEVNPKEQIRPENRRTYAQITESNVSQRTKPREPKKQTNQKTNQKALQIDALQIGKEGKSPEEIQKELEDEFNPEEKGWNVVSVRRGKKTVVLKVDRETEEKMRADPDLKDKGFTVKDNRTRRPRIAILAVPTEATYAQVIQHMPDIIGNIDDGETPKKLTWITEKLNRYRSAKTVILEVEPYIRQRLIKKGKVRVGLQICHITDSNIPTQCRQCFLYTHRTAQCTQPVHCAHCGGPGHIKKYCTYKERPPTCRNCTDNNRNNTSHASMDQKCPRFKTALMAWEKTVILHDDH